MVRAEEGEEGDVDKDAGGVELQVLAGSHLGALMEVSGEED